MGGRGREGKNTEKPQFLKWLSANSFLLHKVRVPSGKSAGGRKSLGSRVRTEVERGSQVEVKQARRRRRHHAPQVTHTAHASAPAPRCTSVLVRGGGAGLAPGAGGGPELASGSWKPSSRI